MEYVYRVKTAQTKSMYRETFWSLYYNDTASKIKYALQLLFMLGFDTYGIHLTLTCWTFYSGLYRVLVILACAGLLYCFYRLTFQANIFAKKEEKKRQKLVGNELVYTDILFYDSYFCVCSAISSAKETVAYADVLALDDTKHYYIIRTKVGAVAFDKNGFIDGTCEQAVQLLCEKGNIT